MATKAEEKLIEIFKTALQTEHDGEYFYRMAAKLTNDEKGKATFNLLAEEEKKHQGYLAEHYNALKEKGEIATGVAIDSAQDLSGTSPILSDDITTRIDEAHYEMSALSVGVQLEKTSMQFYAKHAKEAEQNEVKAFFERLADWESMHYNALLKQQDMLKEAFWAKNAFAPF